MTVRTSTPRGWRAGATLGLVVATVAALPTALRAQQGAPVRQGIAVGQTVRVRAATPPPTTLAGGSRAAGPATTAEWRGQLVRIDAEAIVVLSGVDTMSIPRRIVDRLDVRTGERDRHQSIMIYGGIGAGIGALTGATVSALTYEPCSVAEYFCFTRTQEMVGSAILVGLVGGVIGGAVGAFKETGQWRRVTLTPETRVALIVTPRRGGVSITF